MIKILDYVNPLSFFIAFCIGIFVVYISTPEPKVIYKYPTPDNVDKNIYKDPRPETSWSVRSMPRFVLSSYSLRDLFIENK